MNIIKKRLSILLVLILVLLLVAISNVFVDVWFTKLERLTIDSDKVEKGKSVKILQISDVHNKKVADSDHQLIQLVQRAQPDIIAITGDLIDDNTKSLEYVYALIEGISAVNPKIYFVTGNHEWRGGMAAELMKGLTERGVIVLDNRNEVVKAGESMINLCGVADWTSGKLDLKSAIKGMDNGNFTVMLAHDPWIIHDYRSFVPDLTLSGHTHGGQIRLPVVGAIAAPGQKLFPELDKGYYEVGKNKILYIDSGVGTSVIPLRFLNSSQVTLITIE